MQEAKSDTDPRRGWFKLLIPDIEEAFSGLFWSKEYKIEPLPFMYGRLDPEQVSFDCALSVPYLAIDRAVLVQIDKRSESQQLVAEGEVAFQLQIIPLKLLARDQENRCYVPADLVTCIIPVDITHPIVHALVQITSESDLIIPSGLDLSGAAPPGQILDMAGRVLKAPAKDTQENETS